MLGRMKETRTSVTRSRRPRRSVAEWREEIAGWKRSGLSASEYAADHDVAASSLFAWSRRIRLAPEPAPEPRVSFVPVRVTAEALSSSFEVEVSLGNGRRVRARGDVDAARFARMLDALEGSVR